MTCSLQCFHFQCIIPDRANQSNPVKKEFPGWNGVVLKEGCYGGRVTAVAVTLKETLPRRQQEVDSDIPEAVVPWSTTQQIWRRGQAREWRR